MTEPTETDLAIDNAEPGDSVTEAPLTTDDEAQKRESVVNPETS
ncbi:MAG: hypothetical protein JWN61_2067 [Pseudonocardiales bacterium]|nr:hypothetical protein [Jatrophihabitantaceae bacterium]MCW2603932.1 hypothetical protein [Pseudonocardiales bacterium]